MFKFDRKSCPSKPGIYIYKDKFKEIIYIGKAKNLKNRVSSYFSQKHENSIKTQFLVRNIDDVEYIVVDNEIEALILENKLIKKHKPKYNIDLKDSATYAYIKITDDKIPKIQTVRKVTKGGEYFGPFTDGSLRNELFALTVRIFKLVTNKTYSTKSKLNFEIGIAPAPSEKEINIEEYNKNVNEARLFLKGKNVNKTLKRLKEEMDIAKDTLKYEEAMEKKKQIEAIMYLREKQNVELVKKYDQDVIAIIRNKSKGKVLIVLFNINEGILSGKKEFRFEDNDNIFLDFIKMYYSTAYIPKEIIVSEEFWNEENSKELLEEYLSQKKDSKVIINKPQKGDKLSLVKLAIKNGELNFEGDKLLIEIKDKFRLPKLPNVIECFDMSNLSYDFLVGGMTRWINLKADKNSYRKFEIKSFTGKNDDTSATLEVIYRRYNRLKKEGKEYPDLIIVDGGKGHLNSALTALKRLDLDDLPIISIAKGSRRDKNEVYFPGESEPEIFDDKSEMMLKIREMRDSVHNFVINYNRKKRDMKFKKEMK